MKIAENKPLFVIDNDPIVDWPVIVKLPAAGGTFDEYQFTVSMRVLAPSAYEALFSEAPGAVKSDAGTDDGEIKKLPNKPLSEIVQLNTPIFQRIVTGWSGITDRDGNTVAYSPEKLAEQITGPRGPALSTGLWRAISEVRYGIRMSDGTEIDGARLGN